MFPTKNTLALLTLALFSIPLLAQEPVRNQRTKTLKPTRRSPQLEYHLGIGYLQWSEKISISRATLESRGISSYAGPALLGEIGFATDQWFWLASGGLAFGRAASGAYDGSLTFDDGNNRAWTSYLIGVSGAWRMNRMISGGIGLAGHYRKVDWEPQDRTLLVESRDPIAVYPKIDLRLRLSTRLEFLQSYAPISTDRESLWTWASYVVF